MAKKYNILYTSISGDNIGGGQKSLLLLLERLDREKYNPILLCPNYGSFTKKVEKLGIEISLFKTGSLKNPNVFSFAGTIRKLIKIIRQNNIDLIHTDARRQTFYAGIAAKLTKKPIVWHVRISDPEIKQYDKTLFFLVEQSYCCFQSCRNTAQKSSISIQKNYRHL